MIDWQGERVKAEKERMKDKLISFGLLSSLIGLPIIGTGIGVAYHMEVKKIILEMKVEIANLKKTERKDSELAMPKIPGPIP